MQRLSIDIGGTFTDVVLQRGETLASLKILTTPAAPEEGALNGVDQLLRREGSTLAQVHDVVHGTTLATNALIERRGARTALVTTEGFRDILEMGHEKRFDQYDVALRLPVPLVPRELRLTLRERLDARGRALIAPDSDEIDALADRLRSLDVQAVAVGLLHAYANPDHERRVAEQLGARLGDAITVCRSAEVSPEIREYERFSTVCANAYVRPLMSRYLQRFDALLREGGLTGPMRLMLSGGGLTTLAQAMRVPIRLVESGPAGGVALGSRVARQLDAPRLLAFDMGGTTAKICFLEEGVAATARRFEVARAWRDMKGSGLPVRIPTTELVEIGAGGGSIARRDALGRLAVGPESAGSTPGPAAYGRGGESASVTDADVVLGKLSAEGFAGGAFTLRPDLAEQAVATSVTGPLAFSSNAWAATGIVEIAQEAMANAARVHALERGKDITGYTLMASGGAGPLHAVRIAEKLDMRRVIVPCDAGVGSAVGFLSAPLAYEVARTVLQPLQAIDVVQLALAQQAMASEACAVIEPALPEDAAAEVVRHAELRYLGQGHALQIELEAALDSASALATLADAFSARYAEVYGVTLDDNPVELVALSLVASGPVPVEGDARAVSSGTLAPAGTSARVFDASSGDYASVPVHQRDDLSPGDRLAAPCLVRESQTTSVLPAGWQGHVHATGHLIFERTPTA